MAHVRFRVNYVKQAERTWQKLKDPDDEGGDNNLWRLGVRQRPGPARVYEEASLPGISELTSPPWGGRVYARALSGVPHEVS
jgi:hypothetical protein